LSLELSLLKANSEADSKALTMLSAKVKILNDSIAKLQGSLTDTESALTQAQAQLEEDKIALKELKASLDKSKNAALFVDIGIGAGGIAVGLFVGFMLGVTRK
jgi:hypothetical protein